MVLTTRQKLIERHQKVYKDILNDHFTHHEQRQIKPYVIIHYDLRKDYYLRHTPKFKMAAFILLGFSFSGGKFSGSKFLLGSFAGTGFFLSTIAIDDIEPHQKEISLLFFRIHNNFIKFSFFHNF